MTELNLQHLSRPEAFQTTISVKVREKAHEVAAELHGKILDVGCGNGIFLLEWSAGDNQSTQLFGLDYDGHALSEAKLIFKDNHLSPDRFIRGDAFHLPFPENSFDAVFCLNTLINIHPFTRVSALLSELHRVCKKNGKIVFDYRNAYNPVLKSRYVFNSVTGRLTTHAHRWSDFSELRMKLGIQHAEKKSIGSWFPLFSLGFMAVWEKE
ncbi:MAG: class I SAM-dependent methyltransferase [Candidatus Marinimicrobia bacterium]|nr:class I SAM-dependent methyltransferase [Candidatus Neomarinimicrobiota bacterium]